METASSIELLRAAQEHHRAGRLAEAENGYRHAVELLNAAVTEARLNLGIVLREMARREEATEVLGQLVVDHPNLAAGWLQLALAVEPQGFGWEAHKAVAKALKKTPDADTLIAAAGLLLKLKDTSAAESAVRRALEMSPRSATAWIQLGHVLTADGRLLDAAAAYQQALSIEPANAVASYILAARDSGSGSEPAAARPAAAPPEYVRGLFDGCAEQFDTSLVVSLKYRVPELLDRVYSEWQQRSGAPAKRLVMMDAGCGTGLCGLWMARYRGKLTGVDLSRGMIAVAKECEVYDEFFVGEVAEELEKRPVSLDLIVAGDVLVYIGDLTRVFSAVSAALKPGGVFLFSVEAFEGSDFVLRPTQRYAHAKKYLHRLAAANDLIVRVTEEAVLRLEKGADVGGYLMLVEKTL